MRVSRALTRENDWPGNGEGQIDVTKWLGYRKRGKGSDWMLVLQWSREGAPDFELCVQELGRFRLRLAG